MFGKKKPKPLDIKIEAVVKAWNDMDNAQKNNMMVNVSALYWATAKLVSFVEVKKELESE